MSQPNTQTLQRATFTPIIQRTLRKMHTWEDANNWLAADASGEKRLFPISEMVNSHLYLTICWAVDNALRIYNTEVELSIAGVYQRDKALIWLLKAPAFCRMVQIAIDRRLSFPKEVVSQIKEAISLIQSPPEGETRQNEQQETLGRQAIGANNVRQDIAEISDPFEVEAPAAPAGRIIELD